MTFDELFIEALQAKDHFWFIQSLETIEWTKSTITLKFVIDQSLFVQIYCSIRSERLNFALVGTSGRLYGRDREHGVWHRHPFEDPSKNEPTPAGMSSKPIIQFLSEVETIIIDNDLI